MTTTLTAEGTLFQPGVVSAAARAAAAAEPQRLAPLRRTAAERFEELGLPTTRLEEWRFTDLRPIRDCELRLAERPRAATAGDIAKYGYEGCHQVVLSQGHLVPELSRLDALPEGLEVCGLAEALERHPELLDRHLGRYAQFDEHAFVALNTALHADGVVVWVRRGAVVETPINLVLLSGPAEGAVASFPRLLIVAEESSQATVIEQYASHAAGSYLTAPVTEIVLGDNAVIDHYKLQRESTDAFHLATLQVHQGRDSNFSSHSISWGGGLVRNDVNAKLDGEGGEATLNGLYMVEGSQLVDNHMRVEHAQPHCDSHELYKGILEGRSRAVFNGRIYVYPGAQKTDAKQTNRNLLLSKRAVCNSNPQLEIFADDVKCTHGSTVGQLDDTAVFYLRSRGIGEVAAKSLLTYAFAADIVERIKFAPVRADLEEFLFRRLPRGEVVRQAV